MEVCRLACLICQNVKYGAIVRLFGEEEMLTDNEGAVYGSTNQANG